MHSFLYMYIPGLCTLLYANLDLTTSLQHMSRAVVCTKCPAMVGRKVHKFFRCMHHCDRFDYFLSVKFSGTEIWTQTSNNLDIQVIVSKAKFQKKMNGHNRFCLDGPKIIWSTIAKLQNIVGLLTKSVFAIQFFSKNCFRNHNQNDKMIKGV